MQITWPALLKIAELQGHTRPTVRESRRGWAALCGCGFSSPRVPTLEQAEQLAADHISRVGQSYLAKQRASGRSADQVMAALDARAS